MMPIIELLYNYVKKKTDCRCCHLMNFQIPSATPGTTCRLCLAAISLIKTQ